MKNFEFVNPTTIDQALGHLSADPGAVKVIAGGTDILDELKEGIEAPTKVVNLGSVRELNYVKFNAGSGLTLGAMATVSGVAANAAVQERYGVLAEAAMAVASPQIRNQGTVGGNLCQRPRCWYYRGRAFWCYKKGGDFCFAVTGENKYLCIIGGELCYIVHPSDLAVALVALGANARIAGPGGERVVPLEDFFVGPRVDVLRENVLKPNELLVEIQVPTPEGGMKGKFLKVRERKSWDFAMVSAAVCMAVEGGTCKDARVVLGGCAPTPLRVPRAEEAIKGKRLSEDTAAAAGTAAVQGARPMSLNEYKVTIARNLVKRAVMEGGA
jgi:xanthine dehydrogenase YagS FAD-binding subunit